MTIQIIPAENYVFSFNLGSEFLSLFRKIHDARDSKI